MRKFSGIWLAMLISCGSLVAEPLAIDTLTWKISGDGNGITQHLGRTALVLKGGRAILKKSAFEDGIIEFDIAFPAERNFVGVMWRMQDGGNFEEFYMRPHQSGEADANQYSPVLNGNSGWQLYHGEGYSAPTRYRFNEWMPVKVVVAGKRAEIYIIDMEKPALTTQELKGDFISGQIGFKAGGSATAYISDIRITPGSNPVIIGVAPEIEAAPAHTLMSYQVSGHFPGSGLQDKVQLTAADKKGLRWQAITCEENGIANLSRLQSNRGDNNTVFVKITLQSQHNQVKRLQFGYSDRVRVYVNDQLVYSGDNGYATRDFRYLGTIGLFDALYLPIKKGRNEVWFAVSETFGGWGILSQLEDVEGLTVEGHIRPE